jgi:uncharacterized protein with HEPN domain
MFHDVTQSVMDAVDACRAIQEFSKGQTLENYQTDRLRRLAIERLFEILGEALNRVDAADPSFRDQLPEMGNIIGMRNRIAHGYDNVQDEVIWLAVEKRIPDLTVKLATWLDEASKS